MELEDENIEEMLKNDMEHGFRLFMRKYKETVYWHIRRIVVSHEDAQDATQEAFLRIFRSYNQRKKGSSFKAWVYKIATNEALRLLEKRKTGEISFEDNIQDSIQKTTDSYVNYDRLELKFQKAIQTLSDKQRITFNLRYYDELDYEDIARVMDTSSSSAKANYHIAKTKIVQYMNSND